MSLPKITAKQQEIVKLLYKHRFVERKQIQQYFKHIDKRRSTRWLKDLKDKKFVDWIYDSSNPNDQSKPAMYFLETNGIRFLRELGVYPEDELRKRYKDGARKQDFIESSLLLTECCLHLDERNREDPEKLHYDYAIEADYIDPDNEFFFLAESEYIHPNLVFTKQLDAEDEFINQTYLVQLFGVTTPRYMIRKKLEGYLEYLQTDAWEESRADEKLPIVLITCPTLQELIYTKRYAKKLLNEIYDGEVPEEVILRFTTTSKLRSNGPTAVIWEDV